VKRALLMVVMLGLLGCASGGEPGPATQAAGDGPQVAEGLEVARVQAAGLSCPACAHSLTQQLVRLPGVMSVELDLGTGEAVVGIDPAVRPGPTAEQLEQAVHDAGFTPQRVIMPGDADGEAS
jgi:copper chaperone CopZ